MWLGIIMAFNVWFVIWPNQKRALGIVECDPDIKIFELTNISINETLSRTLITSITTLLALLSIFFFGGEVLKGFSLAMIFGVIFGTYSSIYIANTVLVRLKVSQKTVLREDDNN